MSIFKPLKSAIGKIFGNSTKLHPHFRQGEAAETEVKGQAARRKALLQRRVKAGLSREEYPNRKNVDLGDSPYQTDFLDGFPLSRFASSNVYAIVYDRIKSILHIQFMGGTGRKRSGPGKWVAYLDVSISDAKEFYNGSSKGIKVWDLLRVRGTQGGMKKNFARGIAPPAYLPLGRKKPNILQSP